MATSTVPDTRPDSQAGHDPSYLLVLWEASIRRRVLSPVWLHAPLTPNTGRQRKVDLCRSEASLIYTGVPGQSEIQK